MENAPKRRKTTQLRSNGRGTYASEKTGNKKEDRDNGERGDSVVTSVIEEFGAGEKDG